MKTPAIEPLTDGEERIMQMLWSLGEGTVNDILAVIPEPKPKYHGGHLHQDSGK